MNTHEQAKHKRLEQALLESEARYQSLYVDSRDAIMTLSPDRGFLAGNPATIKLFACRDEQDFTTHTPASLSPEYQPDGAASTEKAQEMMRLALKKGSHFFDWTHRRADGTDFPATVLLSRLESGGAWLLQATVRDITEQKKMEAALQASEQKFRDYIERAPDGVFIVDNTGRFLEVNEAGCRIAGYSREELEHLSIRDLLAKESLEDGLAHFRKVMETGAATSDLWHMHKDGSKRCWTVDAVKLSETQVLGFNKDITERKLAESEIRDLAKFPAENPSSILRVARNGKLLYVNTAGLNLLPDWHLRIGRVVTRSLRKVISHALNTGSLQVLDIEHRDRLFSFSVAPIPEENYANVYGRDVTEQKRAEARIRMFSREIMAVREKEKKRVASALHHDVGSLAVGLSAHFDAIEEDIRCGKTRESLKWMKRARKLFEQSVARLKQVAVQLRPPELDVLGLSAALRHHFTQVTKRGGIRIHFTETVGRRQVPDDVATVVFRIVQEALTNAIKHGHAKKVDVRLSASKKELSLKVRNDGKGFHPGLKRGQRSSHLGLRMMEEMATSIGGILTIDSAPGKATTVSVRLPIGGM